MGVLPHLEATLVMMTTLPLTTNKTKMFRAHLDTKFHLSENHALHLTCIFQGRLHCHLYLWLRTHRLTWPTASPLLHTGTEYEKTYSHKTPQQCVF